MKLNYLLIITLGLLISFTSCNKDDETDLITGNWILNQINISVDPSEKNIPGINDSINKYIPDNLTLTFREDRIYSINGTFEGVNETIIEDTYNITTKKLTFNLGLFPMEMPYTLSAKKLSLQYSVVPRYILSLMDIFIKTIEDPDEQAQLQAIIDMISEASADINSITIHLQFDKK